MSVAIPFLAFLLAGAFAAFHRLRLAAWAQSSALSRPVPRAAKLGLAGAAMVEAAVMGGVCPYAISGNSTR